MNRVPAEGTDRTARLEPRTDAPEPPRVVTAACKQPFTTVTGRVLVEYVWTNEDGRKRRQARESVEVF